jgi:PAS domain S-box-containing protein
MSEHEFGVDIAERTQAQRRMDELFRALIENALDVITILDAEGVIRYQSPSVERAMGYKPAELIGLNIVELLHPDDVPKVNVALKAAAPPDGTPGIAQVVEARLRHKDGSWRILESIGKELPSGLPMRGIVVNSRDITERVRAEEEIRQRNRELAARNVMAAVVSQSLNLDEILNAALDKMLELIHLDVGGIYLADPVRRKLNLVVHRSISKEFAREVESVSVDEKTLEAVLAEGKLRRFILSVEAVVKDRVELKRILSAMRKEGLSLAAGVPVLLQAKEEIQGLMIVASRVPRQFTKAELRLLTSVGQHIAVAIQNARLFEEEKRRITQLALISEVGEKAASILDLDRLMPEVTRSIQERFNYYNVALFLLDKECREVVMQAVAGGFERMAPGEYRQSLDEGIIGFVARTGKSWLASDVSQDPYYVKGFLEEVLTKSELCIPVKLGDKVIGALDVQSSQMSRPWRRWPTS